MMIRRLKNPFSDVLKIGFANPILGKVMLFMSFSPPREGTWNDFQASLIGGVVAIVVVFLFRQVFEKDMDLRHIQSLPEINAFQYVTIIFICAEIMALSMVFGYGLANIYHPRPIDWSTFVGLTVLKNLILSIPLGIWGWFEHYRIRNVTV